MANTARPVSLVLFLLFSVGGGLLIGLATQPGTWYASLEKPWFNPPNSVFGPVWTLLYVMIGVAGWRIFERDRRSGAMKLWVAQMVLNFAWSPAFFAAEKVGLALVVVVALLVAVAGFIVAAWRWDRLAAWLFVPYLAWVAFATLLNASIWWLN